MIGQLLVGAGIVPETTMQEFLVKAKNSSCRIGETLVRAGYINTECLQSTLLAQNLVSTGAVTQRTALKLVASTTRNRIPLAKLTDEPDLDTQAECLTTLLVESDLVKREVIAQVKTQCKVTQKGITQTLQSIGCLSNRDLDSVFHALSMMCDSEITKQEATVALRMAHQQNRRVQEFLPESLYALAKPCNSYADLESTMPDLEAYTPNAQSKNDAKESWFSTPEFAIILGTILLVIGMGLGNYYFVPVECRSIGYCSIGAIAAILLMIVGFLSRKRGLKNEVEREVHLLNAQETKSRLSRFRSSAC